MPYVGDVLSAPFTPFAADGTIATGLDPADFDVVCQAPDGEFIVNVIVEEIESGAAAVAGNWRAYKAATTYAQAGEYFFNIIYSGSPALIQNEIPVYATSIDSSWIATIASIYSLLQTVAASVATLLSRMLTGIYATSRVDPISGNINQIVVGDSYNNAKGTAFEWTSDSWADYDIDSVNATLTFYCRAKEGGDILFTATCTAPAANRLRLELDDTDTRKLSPVVNRALVFQIKVAWSDAVTSSPLTLVDGVILRVIPNRST